MKLTDLAGRPIWVLKAWVQIVREPLPAEYDLLAGSVLVLSGERQAVRESPNEVMERMNGDTG